MSNRTSAESAWRELQTLAEKPLLVACMGRILSRMRETQSAEPVLDAEVLGQFETIAVVTSLGDVGALLRRGPEQPGERALGSALAAASLADEAIESDDAWGRLTTFALWLASRSAYDPFPCIENAFADRAPRFWHALAGTLTEGNLHSLSLSRGDRALGAVLLSHHAPDSPSAAIGPQSDEALSSIAIRREQAPLELVGEWSDPPRSTAKTVLYTLSGILVVSVLARLTLKHVLRMKEPATLEHSPLGIRYQTHKELLGKRLLERTYVVSHHALSTATRETRYSRASLYAGLVALLIGTYLGISWLVDGVRSASVSLIGTAILVFALGALIDYALGRYLPSRSKQTRVVLTPKNGRALCMQGISEEQADLLLRRIAECA